MADYSEIVLNGHGGWTPQDNPAFAQVPKGTTIKFLTGNFKLMLGTVIENEDEALDSLQQFRDADPSQVGTEFKSVPNYVLSEATVDGSQVPPWVLQVHGDTPLCTNDGSDPKVACDSGIHRCAGLFADDRVIGATLYWGACRFVAMNAVGSPEYYAESGVNQRQPDLGTAGEASVELSNDATDLWLDQIASLGDDDDALTSWMDQAKSALTEDQMTMVGRRVQERFPDYAANHGINP
jgi:hypothetical protein